LSTSRSERRGRCRRSRTAAFNLSLVISAAFAPRGRLALGLEAAWLDWAELVLGLALAAAKGALLRDELAGRARASSWLRGSGSGAAGAIPLRKAGCSGAPRVDLRCRLLGVSAWIGRPGVLTAALGFGRIV